ncbi:single-stranded-DNA-specific exonuclease RecJ [Govanella unica]|uniref:Single-stranded-DNA-specific exonuclease RecJ n=1 Tax=Govanella unica TaxID=2975056 RepID=A0A9X3TY59_9PROT|nr:single-stranded-DNA-specific exonuclease RecJ [Govania unica]MDA5194120.1 single-stranded-DNA-specific exonuclease RecJ [Govania unica]
METDDLVLGVAQSLQGRAWRFRPALERQVGALRQTLHIPEMLARVLAGRGIELDDAAEYLNPSLRALMPDPSVLQDMDKAAARVAEAIIAGEEVAVFGDYDVDGATSSALLQRFFVGAGGRLRIYIPDRIAEGYGPNIPALLKLKAEGVALVITVDCGISAHAQLTAARDAGLEVMVVDHHMAEPALPPAVAIVNPNRLDDDSGLGYLAAVGVAFLLCVAVNRALRARGWYGDARPEPDLMALLDLVALGTVADVVPLVGLNRALVSQGLKVMGRSGNIGLQALMKVARLDEPPGPYHLGFLLGPRVNAGGRVGEAELGARLLTTLDSIEAAELAQALDRYNGERQAIEAGVQDDALARLFTKHGGEPAGPMAFVAGEDWHPGVIGIVAGRLKERYEMPSLVIAIDDQGIGKGSARSITGVDLGAAVTAARQAGILINGGGHKMAAGLTVEAARIPELEAFLIDRLSEPFHAARASRALLLDGALSAGAVSIELIEQLLQAGPYGAGNPSPRFALPHMKVAFADVVGADHVRATFEGLDGSRIKGVAFRAATTDMGQAILTGHGRRFHVAANLKINSWNGRRTAEIQIEDAALVG